MKRVYAPALDATKDKYVGKILPSNNYGDFIILEYNAANDVKIKFLDTGFVDTVFAAQMHTRKVRDSSLPTTCGFGYIDIEGASIGRKMTKEYQLWNNMITRCYNENLRHKNPTYKDCHVSEEWRYLSNFKEWCNNQIGFNEDGWHLDKDILSKDNKVYSEDTCVFVPSEINSMLTNSRRGRGAYPVGVYYKKRISKYASQISKNGEVIHLGNFDTPEEAFYVYKEAKEDYIKQKAEFWKGQIDPKVYDALMNFTIEITD